jgi:hypothetical protein
MRMYGFGEQAARGFAHKHANARPSFRRKAGIQCAGKTLPRLDTGFRRYDDVKLGIALYPPDAVVGANLVFARSFAWSRGRRAITRIAPTGF